MLAPAARRVDAVLFDLDDTLVPFQTVARWQWAWRPHGPILSERHARAAIRRQVHAWDRQRWVGSTGKGPLADLATYRTHLHATLAAIAGHAVAATEADPVVERFMKPTSATETFPDAAKCVDDLRRDGVRLGVATLFSVEVATEFVRRAGLGAVTVISAPGTPELPPFPSKAAFRRASEALGTPVDRMGYVGDLFWSDFRAARRAHLVPFLVERPGHETEGEAERVRDLIELPKRLAEAGPTPPVGPVADEPSDVPPPPE
ncbi:MAG TPA: HAD family hydrolase [Thermoplasmata archaeon]|nr:HAD family hydrolase [Thermoplasmata archaeon]